MPIDSSATVAALVVERPSRARLLEKLGLDYCCGGRRSLAEACAEAGLDAATVAAMLDAIDESPATAATDWSAAPLRELVDHIVSVHHERLRAELPRISTLVEKCARAHGGEHPELHNVREVFERMREELERHMAVEETALFPAVRAAEAGEPAELEVGGLEAEHEATGAALARLRELSGGFDPDAALCNTHRATLDALAALELDLHEHIHEENNILFPRALALEGAGRF